MINAEIKNLVLSRITDKLRHIGIGENELGSQFDLVKSGLVNSLEFVDLVTSLEKELHCEIDFETALEKGELTTLGGLVKLLEEGKNG